MNIRLLIIPALMVSALCAQGPGGFDDRLAQGPGTAPTPPTAEQAATQEVNMIWRALGLNSTQSSSLLSALACSSCALTAEQTTLQANAATLKTDYATLGTDLTSTPPASTSATVNAINGIELTSLQARVTAAGAVLTELKTLSISLTATQQTNLIKIVVRGGFGGGFRR